MSELSLNWGLGLLWSFLLAWGDLPVKKLLHLFVMVDRPLHFPCWTIHCGIWLKNLWQSSKKASFIPLKRSKHCRLSCVPMVSLKCSRDTLCRQWILRRFLEGLRCFPKLVWILEAHLTILSSFYWWLETFSWLEMFSLQHNLEPGGGSGVNETTEHCNLENSRGPILLETNWWPWRFTDFHPVFRLICSDTWISRGIKPSFCALDFFALDAWTLLWLFFIHRSRGQNNCNASLTPVFGGKK